MCSTVTDPVQGPSGQELLPLLSWHLRGTPPAALWMLCCARLLLLPRHAREEPVPTPWVLGMMLLSAGVGLGLPWMLLLSRGFLNI